MKENYKTVKFFDRIMNLFGSRTKKRQNAQSIIPFRLNMLLWIVGILLLALTIRLFYLQVLQGTSFKAEVKRSDTTTQTRTLCGLPPSSARLL